MPGLSRTAVAGLIVGLCFAFPARAELSPQQVGELLAAATEATGQAKLTYASATAPAPGTINFSDVKVVDSDGKGGNVAIPLVVLTGVAERSPGGFTAERITFDNGTAVARNLTTTWTTAVMDDVVVPSADEIKARSPARVFATLNVGKGQVAGLSAPVDFAGIEVAISDVIPQQPGTMELKAAGVRIPTSLLSETVAGAVISMLRYDEFLTDITMRSTYDPVTDIGTLDILQANVPSVGSITLAGKASAFAIAEIMSADAEVAKQARAAARLSNFSVRLDNAGFVERMLDMQAEMLGGTRDDVRTALVGGALPFALSFIKDQAFRQQFQTEVSAFLEDPKSLTIAAKPPEPVPLGQVIRSLTRAPSSLPDLLSPTVKANQ